MPSAAYIDSNMSSASFRRSSLNSVTGSAGTLQHRIGILDDRKNHGFLFRAYLYFRNGESAPDIPGNFAGVPGRSRRQIFPSPAWPLRMRPSLPPPPRQPALHKYRCARRQPWLVRGSRKLTDASGRRSVEMGFRYPRTTMSSPFEMPPSMPPALLCSRVKRVCAPAPGRCSRWRRGPRIQRNMPQLLPGQSRPPSRPAATSRSRRECRRDARPSWRRCQCRQARRAQPPRRLPPMVSPVLTGAIDFRLHASFSVAGSAQFSSTSSWAGHCAISSQWDRAPARPAHSDDVAGDLNSQRLQKDLGEGSAGNPRGGLPRGSPFEHVTCIREIELQRSGEVRMAGARRRDGLMLGRIAGSSTGRISSQFFQSWLAISIATGDPMVLP